MENRDTNRINMINTTIGYADDNTAATSGISQFAIVLAAVKAKMVLINNANILAGGATSGVTLDTKALRAAMEGLTMKCAHGTLAYANSTSNNTLKALVAVTESGLKSEKKEDVDDVCERVKNACNANIAGATPFGVTATDVTDLATAIGLYRTATQNPRNAIISKSQANTNAGKMIGEVINDLLRGQMDAMADTLKISNKDFWSGWQQAREIIDLGSTTAKLRGTVLDEMDVPISNVKVTLFKTATSTLVKQGITDGKGKFNIADLPVGSDDLKWEIAGYNTIDELNVKVSAGKELKRKIVMKKV